MGRASRIHPWLLAFCLISSKKITEWMAAANHRKCVSKVAWPRKKCIVEYEFYFTKVTSFENSYFLKISESCNYLPPKMPSKPPCPWCWWGGKWGFLWWWGRPPPMFPIAELMPPIADPMPPMADPIPRPKQLPGWPQLILVAEDPGP